MNTVNSKTYTTIQLSQIMRDIAGILERDDPTEIAKLYAACVRTTHQLSATCVESFYRKARNEIGLCLALTTILRPLGSVKDRITCVDIVDCAIHNLYPPPRGTYFSAADPFKAYGASYYEPTIDWKFRAEAARRIADWIIKNFEDYTLTSNLENDNEQL